MRRAVVLAALGAALAVPTSAQGQVAWQQCTSPVGFECGTLDVPVDRAGSVPGTVSLSAVRRANANNPRRAALVPLAGGPGQAAVPIAREFADLLKAGLADRDLLVFDQRGTGQSSPLRCAALSTAGSLDQVTQRCGQQLGPARAFFRTPESVQDLEALRIAAGYEKLALYGVSYGTKVALAYAAAFPERVEALVLDSVVLPEGPDALRRQTLQSAPRVIGELCAGGRCAGATPDVTSDLAVVALRLRGKALRGTVFDGAGKRRTATLGESGLVDVIIGSDLDPAARTELPAALRAARTGDTRPLLRLSARVAGLSNGAQVRADQSDDSTALQLTTTCEENPTFPWTRGAGASQHAREAAAAVAAQPAGSSGPFGPKTMLGGLVRLCSGWPTASPAPPDTSAPLAQVPTLVLNGRGDTRTPLEDAQQLTTRIAGMQLVGLPFVGHSVLGVDVSGCAVAAVTAFFSGQTPGDCANVGPAFPVTARPPATLGRTPAYPGVKGKAGRTLEALRLTVNDARRQVIGATLAVGATPDAVGGLRGGRVVVSRDRLRLRAASYVPGVLVTGTLPERGTARLRVSGRSAARGSITVSASGAVRGTLGGRRVRTSFRTASASSTASSSTTGLDRLPSLREARARGRVLEALR